MQVYVQYYPTHLMVWWQSLVGVLEALPHTLATLGLNLPLEVTRGPVNKIAHGQDLSHSVLVRNRVGRYFRLDHIPLNFAFCSL